jgi:hypothetical protein
VSSLVGFDVRLESGSGRCSRKKDRRWNVGWPNCRSVDPMNPTTRRPRAKQRDRSDGSASAKRRAICSILVQFMAEEDADERIGYRVGGIAVLGTSQTRGEWWCKKWEYVTKWSAWLEASVMRKCQGDRNRVLASENRASKGETRKSEGARIGEGCEKRRKAEEKCGAALRSEAADTANQQHQQ